jgi:serine/threonine-protein kinase
MSSSRENWERAQAVFDAVRAEPADRRAAFLEASCPDPELRGEVAALLQAHEALEHGAGPDFLAHLDAERAAALLSSTLVEPGAAGPGTQVGRYRIVRRLADGGMGVVFLAQDPRLNRPVALKLLPRHLSLDAGARARFEEEARAASALDHPHIVTVHEIGDAPDGQLFIAMAYCDGETLREELERTRPPIPRVLTLARQIADGLAATHASGIVHRDIKPGNVIVTRDGTAKILDFGVAKMAGTDITKPGAVPGTVAYMSPEQTLGATVDARTDVWAFGATLYEMLAGRRAFPGDSEQVVVHAIRHDQPAPLGQVRPDTPATLVHIVDRCLRKNPARRYPDGAALLAGLKRVDAGGTTARRARSRRSGALLAFLLAGSAAVYWYLPAGGERTPAGEAIAAPTRLAVLPLGNDSPDPEDAYLADAVTGELSSHLSGLQHLRVIARTSVARYRNSDESVAAIAGALGVGAVLSGRVRKASGRVRLTVQLRSPAGGQPLWTENYEFPFENLAAVQGEVAERVAAVLQVRMSTAEQRRLVQRGTTNAEAYTAYLRGRYLLGNLDAASFRSAQSHFLEAQRLDPTFARAWSGLADAYQQLASFTALAEEESYPRARAAAERALALEPGLAEAHASLAVVLSMYYRDTQAAERHFRQAIALDPSYARAFQFFAAHLRNLGRLDEALAAVRTAQELDPLSAFPRLEEGIILYVSRSYDATIDKSARLLDAHPNAMLAHLLTALASAQTEHYAGALAALDKADPEGRIPDALAIRGYVLARSGRRVEALDALSALARNPSGNSFQKAVVYIGLGDRDRSLELLERGADERSALMRLIGVDPIMDPLREEPRFRALLVKMGLTAGP